MAETYRKDRCNKHGASADLPVLCSICQRINVERQISEKAVDALLAAGYGVVVQDGESTDYPILTDKAAILDALGTVDDEFLVAHQGDEQIGWIRLVYGNSGYDVISDYTTNLETVLAPVMAFADTMEP